SALQVRRDEQDALRVRVVRAWSIHPHPERVTGPRARRADIRVAVVSIDAPRGEHALRVSVFTGAADVIHGLVRLACLERAANAVGEVVERFVPRHALPFSLAPLSNASQRKEDALGIGDLVEGRRAFRAISPAAARMVRIALELADVFRLLI